MFVCSLVSFSPKNQRAGGFFQYTINGAKQLPVIRSIVKHEMGKQMRKLRASMKKDPDPSLFRAIPERGLSEPEVLSLIAARQKKDVSKAQPNGGPASLGLQAVSGTVYLLPEHQDFLTGVYSQFAHTNPLHGDVYPSVGRMEAEVVSMTAGILGGGPGTAVCGAMTSGGTESILTAVKASRDHARATRGIDDPEMIIARSAHPAFIKAAEYFNVRAHIVEVGPDYRLQAKDVRMKISRNTILLVASAPSYPHGVIDEVEKIATLAHERGILCHVDCCLGGFVLPFARDLGYSIPPFDFSVPGVTSISADTHKFGMAHKGTSVVLYRSPEIRQHQYTAVVNWSGGLYISPGFAGSRSGALIATAWASMIKNGLEGYRDATRTLMRAAENFIDGLQKIPDLRVVGRPDACIVAFRSARRSRVNIFELNDWLTARGWHLNALIFPSALHFCFTVRSAGCVPQLLADLGQGCAELARAAEARKGAGKGSGGPGGSKRMAPVYGLASAMPDRGAVGDILKAVQDVMSEL